MKQYVLPELPYDYAALEPSLFGAVAGAASVYIAWARNERLKI